MFRFLSRTSTDLYVNTTFSIYTRLLYQRGIFPSKLRWKIILNSNIFRPDERVRFEFLTHVFSNYSVLSSGTVNCSNCSIWSVAKTHPKLAPIVYKAGVDYGYDSVTWIHPPLFTLWTTYRSHTDA